jgi:hypothetical protein
MGYVNQGNQFITFDFKHKAKGYDFNRLNRNILRRGIYRGMGIAYANNDVTISTGSVLFDTYFQPSAGITNDVVQTKIDFEATYLFSNLEPSDSELNPSTGTWYNEILYLSYQYAEITFNYAEFLSTSVRAIELLDSTAIIIGEITFNLSKQVTGFSYSKRNYGLFTYETGYAFPDSTYFFNIDHPSLTTTKRWSIDGSRISTGTHKIYIPNTTPINNNSIFEYDLLLTNYNNTTVVKNNLSIGNSLAISNNFQVFGNTVLNTAYINTISVSGTSNLTQVNVSGDVAVTGNLTTAENIYIDSTDNSSNSQVGALVVKGGVGIQKNLNVDGNASILSTEQSLNSDSGALTVHGGVGIQKNLNVEGEANIIDYLNLKKTTNLSSLDLVSASGNVTASFVNVDVSFVTLNNAGSTTIVLSVPLLAGNKTRELKLFVKSNGNYTFQNSTSQGSIIYWKTTTNTLGSQPTWLAYDNIVDAHTFIYDGSKLYHIETYSYVVSITAPSNLNYSGNTFDLETHTTHTLIPTLSGTYPMVFSNPTSNLSSGVSLDTNTGNITAYRTSTLLNYVTSTIRATNSSGSIDRSINIRFSYNNSTLTKGSQTYSSTYFNGYNSLNEPFLGIEMTTFGSLSNTNIVGVSILRLIWARDILNYLRLVIGGNTLLGGSPTLNIGGLVFVLDYVTYDGSTNRTTYSPTRDGLSIITENEYNLLQNLSSPMSIRIY